MEETIVNLINNVGFPIMCVLYLIKDSREQKAQQRVDNAEMRKAINELTNMVIKLTEKLSKE